MSHPPLAEEFLKLATKAREVMAPQVADVWERAARFVQDKTKEYDEEPLDLIQAAKESGFTKDHLARLLHDGKLKNYGEPRRPLVRREDLPRKPGYRPLPDPDPAGEGSART